jgi:LPS export ABC transporter protein LptC
VISFCNYIELLLRRSVHFSNYYSAVVSSRYLSGSLSKGTFVLSYRYSALLILLFFSSCENDPKEIENWTKRTELREEAKTIESYLSQSGVMKAKLTAPLMYRYQRDTVFTEFPNTLHVDFYDDSVRVESWLTAKYGIYYDNLNKVFLRDSVVVINKEGDTLRTPELWWDQNMQKFYTTKPSRIDGKDKHIYCRDGIDAPQDMKVFTCHFPTGPFNLKEGITTQ